jgi:hypothetical protein
MGAVEYPARATRLGIMTTLMPALVKPVSYSPAYEVFEEGEAETRDKLMATLHDISETTFKDSGHALRSVHAKSHGLLTGELHVLPDLPTELAQGIFKSPGTWPVVMRLSTIPGDILDDNVSTPRGLAIKVIGVDGERLEGSEGDVTQDFVLVTGAAFGAPTAKKFLSQLKLLAGTTDKAPRLKSALAAVLRGTERALEAVGGTSGTLKTLGGYPETHILGETFYSQAPLLFGPFMAKIAVMPVSPGLRALTDRPLDFSGKPNALRDAVVEYFALNSAEWEVRVQLCTDVQQMPIENAAVPWPENLSPYLAVARITAPSQAAWSAARATAIDDNMSFSPWHGIAAHRPIGSIMRVRKLAYQMSSKFRAEHNGARAQEPQNLDSLAL